MNPSSCPIFLALRIIAIASSSVLQSPQRSLPNPHALSRQPLPRDRLDIRYRRSSAIRPELDAGNLLEAQSMSFTYSTVQCHIKIPRQNKAAGLVKVLQQRFPELSPADIVTVGDSPNDESLFEAQFPQSVGVANVAHYLHFPGAFTDLHHYCRRRQRLHRASGLFNCQ